jgi:flagellar hook-basal body complex protein FliE
MSNADISSVLAQMRAIAAQAQGGVDKPGPAAAADGPDFASLLKQSLDQVNSASKEAGALTNAFERGDPKVDLVQVMIAREKASISFQAMTQVRNKLIEAYRDIKSMPI